MAGYSHTTYRLGDNYGKGAVNTYDFGVYGSFYATPQWYVDGVATYGYGQIKTDRQMSFGGFNATAKQKYYAHQFGGLIETGYDFKLPSSLTLTPFINAGLLAIHNSAYTETEAGTVGLNVKSKTATYLQTKLGGQLTKLLQEGATKYYGFAKLAYTYRKGLGNANKLTSNFIGQGNDFTITTTNKPNNIFSPGAGLTVLFNNNVYVTAAYNGDFGKYQHSHEAFIQIGKKF